MLHINLLDDKKEDSMTPHCLYHWLLSINHQTKNIQAKDLNCSAENNMVEFKGVAEEYMDLIMSFSPQAVFYQTITHLDIKEEYRIAERQLNDIEAIRCFVMVDNVRVYFSIISDYLTELQSKYNFDDFIAINDF